MQIKVLGTRGEIEQTAARHSRHSGVLVDKKLLLDLGEKLFLQAKPKAILLTHLHPDHAAFVRHDFAVDFPLYAPEKYKAKEIKLLKKPAHIAGYKITPIPTIHSLKVKSQAYLLEAKNKRLLYTGDMIWIKKKYRSILGKLDLVITEASFVKEGGMIRRDKETGQVFGHAGVPNLCRIFAPYTKTILLVHFGAWFYKDIKRSRKKLKLLGEKYGLNLIVGHDDQQFRI